MGWTPVRPRAVIVGAGSAGSGLAATIADRYDVVVIEAGRWARNDGEDAAQPDDPIAHPASWSLPAELTGERRWRATPGRAVGGSSIVNGGYFVPPAEVDLRHWHAAGGSEWEPQRVLAEIDVIGRRLGVHPSPQTHPIARAFADAGVSAGHSDGLLALGTTFSGGRPRSVADAFLTASPHPIEVRSDCRALRVLIEDGRATGVEVADSTGGRELIAGDEIILCAGGFGTARLLLASGVGPASDLVRAGIDPVIDLPGVGATFSDHATVWVEWVPTESLSERGWLPESDDGAFPIALCVSGDAGPGEDVEILACIQPPDLEAEPGENPPFGVIVGLQRPLARGVVSVTSAHPFAPPKIAYHYLSEPEDRAALRNGVRLAADLLTSAPFAGLVDRLVDLDDATLGNDGLLDSWIAERLGSAAHTCGTAPMGLDADPLAVVDGAGRVRGIRGLRVADTSLLPVVPVRGPASAAMAVGAIIAGQMP